MEIDKIYNIDCIDGLSQLDDKSIDFIFTDPPYNVGKKYDGYNDNKPVDEYIEWMYAIVDQCRRVSRKGFAFYICGDLTRLFLNIIQEGNLIIVIKKAAGVCKNNYALQYHSIISVGRPVERMRNVWDDVRLPGEGYFFREPRYDNPGFTGQQLTENVITKFTLSNDTILDPFMGTGTTACASLSTGRHFIGFEQSEYYCTIAAERLDNL